MTLPNQPATTIDPAVDSSATQSGPTLDNRLAWRQRPPGGRPAMYQSWRDLLFLHWQFPSEAVQATLPSGLTVDTHGGRAWVGVVPFLMRGIRPCWCPPVPGISNFLELNLRTYVYDAQGTPGVWFYSLDANQRLAVWWGRTLFHLPYQSARMTVSQPDSHGQRTYLCQRRSASAALTCRYQFGPRGSERASVPGSLDFFLIERYILFVRSARGALFKGQVVHQPYALTDVDLRHWDEHLLELGGLQVAGRRPDHAAMSRGVDVDVFPLRPAPPDAGCAAAV